MSCYDLDVINSIVKIEGKLRAETPVRIGSGKEQILTEATDNPILKIGGKPVIPGSSLKGAFRSLAEAYVKSLNDSKYIVLDLDSPKDAKSCEDDKVCIPCVLFGFKDLSSRVYILDSIAEQYTISQRTMVTIHRVFGGQYPKHLYTLDFVERGAIFSFAMYIYNLNIVEGENEEWKKKAIDTMKFILRTLTNEGIFIGARKSVGMGLIKLIEGKVTLMKKPDFEPKTYNLAEVL